MDSLKVKEMAKFAELVMGSLTDRAFHYWISSPFCGEKWELKPGVQKETVDYTNVDYANVDITNFT